MQSKHKCQNNETQIVLDYFAKKHGKSFKGNVLDIGANDGVTFSNSFDLIENGWSAWLVEPSSAFEEIAAYYCSNPGVSYYNVAIGSVEGKMILHESGAHVKNGTDKALVSTLKESEKERWPNVDFTEKEVEVVTFDELLFYMCQVVKHSPLIVNYLTIDVEGCEMDILKQIDLDEIGCECLCIEYNSIPSVAKQFTEYCAKFGMKEIHRNAENLIFAR